MEQLTVKEAIEQGYQWYVYASDGYQSLKEITDDDIDWDRDDIWLVDKEPIHCPVPKAKDIAELLADQIASDWGSETGDDTDDVYDAVMACDFTETVKMLEQALVKKVYYHQSKIKLVKE